MSTSKHSNASPDAAPAVPRAAYIHVPFCRHRCGYCNFTVVAGRDDLVDAYLEALERELSALEHPQPVDTLFLGGGTPTHLDPVSLARLLELARRWFPPAADYEWTVEANPSDLGASDGGASDGGPGGQGAGGDRAAERVRVLAAAGVTRLSLGAQSFHSDKLALLERDHTAAEIRRALERARPMFRSLSLDLIFSVPGETAEIWEADLRQALQSPIDHVSCYGLTIEKGTRFYGRQLRGQLAPPAEELDADFYERAIDRLTAAGFEHYEVSNFARPGHACRHNIVYWTGQPYFAAGPGAARYVSGRREVNHRGTSGWLRRVLAGRSPVAESEQLSPEAAARERLVFGLRMTRGVTREHFLQDTGRSLDELAGEAIASFVRLGLLIDDGHAIRLSRRGLLVSDSIWPYLLDDDA